MDRRKDRQQNRFMGRQKKWPNPEMWDQAVLWKRGGLTYREICGRLAWPENMKRFRLEEVPYEDTVRREVSRRMAAGGAAPPHADGALQLEQSRHWRKMQGAARVIQRQLLAPAEQLLGLSRWDESNPSLKLQSNGGDVAVLLLAEEDVLVGALREHLPDDGIWALLEQWKQLVEGIHQRLGWLCAGVKGRPELQSKRWIPLGIPLREREPGLTERFSQIAVLMALEDAYHNREPDEFWERSIRNEYEIRGADGSRRVLRWSLGRMAYVIAGSDSVSKLEALREVHISVRQTLRNEPELVAVVEDYRKSGQVKEELTRELEVIANRSRFPEPASFVETRVD